MIRVPSCQAARYPSDNPSAYRPPVRGLAVRAAFYSDNLTVANEGTTTANYFLKFLGNNRDRSVRRTANFHWPTPLDNVFNV